VAHLLAVDNDGDFVVEAISVPVGIGGVFVGPARLREDFNRFFDKVYDPIASDLCTGVHTAL
jgi:hypothetical protein